MRRSRVNRIPTDAFSKIADSSSRVCCVAAARSGVSSTGGIRWPERISILPRPSSRRLVLLHTGGDARARRMPTLTELSAASRWASALTPKQRDKVDVEVTVRTVAKGGYVCHKGEAVSQWIGVLEGLVKIATTSSGGKLAAFAGIPAGGWFGEGSLL